MTDARADISSAPPRGYFSIWQRLFRGYGPLAVFALMLLLMAVLVPSKDPSATQLAASGGESLLPQGSAGATTPGSTAPGATPGAAGAAGGQAAAPGNGQAASGGAGTVAGCGGQTEQIPGDPYSPPCIAFSGDNGGNTAKGVSGTDITVAFRSLNEQGFQQTLAKLAGASLVDTPDDVKRTVLAYADYFNQHFQFYGRKLNIQFYDGVGSNTVELLGGGRDKAEADAKTVADQIGAFVDLSATSEPYSDALVRNKVIAMGDPYLSREWHTERRPYAWSLATDCSIVTEEVASFAVSQLAGKPATLAGPAMRGQPRKIAVLAPENSWYQECVDAGAAIVQQAGYNYDENIKYQLDLGTMSNQAANIIPKLKSEGITTILCGCDPVMPVFLSGEANRQSYFPEFGIVGVALTDTDIVGQLYDQTFQSHAFGISSLTDPVPQTQTIPYEAYKTVRDDEPAFVADLIYYQMYMLAIGVQMAGPNLTPETFEQGMFNYPDKSGPVGLWGFGPQDYTPQDDYRVIYWDPAAVSSYNGKQGAYIDAAPGTRFTKDRPPTGDLGIPPH